jgi:DNA replicative helicase MCM subunit Mcm2 (Cdc46/Mcm family)
MLMATILIASHFVLSAEKEAKAVENQACLKLLSRRGMVFGHLKKYGDAIRDLEAAVRLAAAMQRAELVQDLERDIALLKKLQEAPPA